MFGEGLTLYLEEHPDDAKGIIDKCLLSARAREAASDRVGERKPVCHFDADAAASSAPKTALISALQALVGWTPPTTFNTFNIVPFASSGTYTPTSGMQSCLVYAWGAGVGGAVDIGGTGGTGGTTSLGTLLTAVGGSGGTATVA